jgi:hypothetical protein
MAYVIGMKAQGNGEAINNLAKAQPASSAKIMAWQHGAQYQRKAENSRIAYQMKWRSSSRRIIAQRHNEPRKHQQYQ